LRTRTSATGAWARWEGIVTNRHAARYQLRRAPAAGALGFRRATDEGVPLTADYGGIRCRFGRPRPLNPFAACRDQRTNGRKRRNGIRRGKPQHSAGGFNPRNENGCDRRVRPHPPPRRSGGPPGCLHPGGPAPIFSTMAARSHVLPPTQRRAHHDRRVSHRSACRCQRRGAAPLRTTPLMCDFAPIILFDR
jgi:hypothetical protein